jgi:hypothetical protein
MKRRNQMTEKESRIYIILTQNIGRRSNNKH